MEKRILFWVLVAIFTIIIIGTVYYISILSFERLIPIDCDITEEWLREKTDSLVLHNFLTNNPNAEFENLGHEDNRSEYCTYVFNNTGGKYLKMYIDGDRKILKTSINFGS